MTSKPHTSVLRFAGFELDPRSGELRKKGDLVPLRPQALKVLTVLATRSGEVVTRDEIRQQIWSGDTFVDFDQGLNFCIRQIRESLGDDAEAPQYIETLPRRGYRFLIPVESAGKAPTSPVTRLIVLPFRMPQAEPETGFLTESLPEAVASSLSGLESLVVRSSAFAARFAGEALDPKRIAADADVDVVLTGTLLRGGEKLRVSTQLTEVPAGTLLWSQTWQVSLGDIFQVHDELTSHIVESLALPLTTREQRMLKRDVPTSSSAYELYLRGNQLSLDSKQWTLARDVYLRCVEEDPRYAPAWARLGRMYHVIGKYLNSSESENLDRAESAFRRALELNPDLAIAHKLYAQLEVDLGRAQDAMVRLVERAPTADPELFAGLVSACRYCGLLDASVAADRRARSLDRRIRTSIAHTHFLRRDYNRVVEAKFEEVPYIAAISLAELGRGREALEQLKTLAAKASPRLREFMTAAQTFIEDRPDESLGAVNRIVSSDFRDPEGLFYLTRHLARLGDTVGAVRLLDRVAAGGFACYPALADDPWLSSLCARAAFKKVLADTRQRHEVARAAFSAANGARLLGMES
jgi:DNA-binding winged helix-turn-helix (wHTH) protein/tetratricopeptide (TPR) repeat protein